MNKIYLLAGYLLFLSSCQNTRLKQGEKQDTVVRGKSIETPIADSTSRYEEVKTWLNDFKNFRQAVYNKDLKKLKTYFNFPLADEGGTIWHLCNLSPPEAKKRKTLFANPDLFYEEDFDKYYVRIFNKDFTKCLLKVKSAELYNNLQTETPEFADEDQSFLMYADYYEEDKNLVLNIAYHNNGTDFEMNEISEGEHNIIYTFNVVDGKYLVLRRIDIAG